MTKMTIHKASYMGESLWYARIHINDFEAQIGDLHPSKKDCVKQAEQIVVAFAKEKIAITHDEIY